MAKVPAAGSSMDLVQMASAWPPKGKWERQAVEERIAMLENNLKEQMQHLQSMRQFMRQPPPKAAPSNLASNDVRALSRSLPEFSSRESRQPTPMNPLEPPAFPLSPIKAKLGNLSGTRAIDSRSSLRSSGSCSDRSPSARERDNFLQSDIYGQVLQKMLTQLKRQVKQSGLSKPSEAFCVSDENLGKKVGFQRFLQLVVEELSVQSASFRLQALFQDISKGERNIYPADLRVFLDKAVKSSLVKTQMTNIWRVPNHSTAHGQLKKFEDPNPEVMFSV